MKPNFKSIDEFIELMFNPYINFLSKINTLNKIIKYISFKTIPSYFRMSLSLGVTSLIVHVKYGAYYCFEKHYKLNGVVIEDDSYLSENLNNSEYYITLGHNTIKYSYEDCKYVTEFKNYTPENLVEKIKNSLNKVKGDYMNFRTIESFKNIYQHKMPK